MKTVHVEDVFRGDEARFWTNFFDPHINEQIYCTELGFPRYRVLDLTNTPEMAWRDAEITARLDLPRAAKSIIGDTFRYREQGTLRRDTGRYEFRLIPEGAIASRFDSRRTVFLRSYQGHLVRIAEVTIAVRIPLFAGVLEEIVANLVESGLRRSAVVVDRLV
jgi:hypothetical protein